MELERVLKEATDFSTSLDATRRTTMDRMLILDLENGTYDGIKMLKHVWEWQIQIKRCEDSIERRRKEI